MKAMRTYSSVVTALLAAFSSFSFLSYAQSALPLPGCKAAPEVRRILDEKLDRNLLEKMKFAERMAYQRRALEDLMARYPREFEPMQRYSDLMSQDALDEYPAIRSRWVQQAKEHPEDPLALLVAGSALIGRGTPEAIHLLEEVRAKAPDFPLPALQLARIYSSGKRADLSKMKENLEKYYAACPASTDYRAQWLLVKDEQLQPKVAASLRVRLQTETDPKLLEAYTTLWGLEFRTRPPKEHDALRAQVAEDLKRLETLNPKGDAEWQAFLITGYKQSGAAKETVTAAEDGLIRDFPHSDQAWEIVSHRWKKNTRSPKTRLIPNRGQSTKGNTRKP